jgi:hypothetical protein
MIDVHLLCEASGIAIAFTAIGVGWRSFRYTERAQPLFLWSGAPTVNWDRSAEISAEAERTRAALTARMLFAVAGFMSAAAIAIGVATAHSDDRIVLIVASALAGCFLAGGLTLCIRHLLKVRVSQAREAFDCFYVGTGLCKLETFEPALARFERENPAAYRIVRHSLTADHKAAAAAHDRETDAYVKALGRALA